VAAGGEDDAADLADVLDRVLEEHEIHDWVVVVVLLQCVLHLLEDFVVRDLVVVAVHLYAQREVAEDQVLRRLPGEVLGKVELGELLLDDVEDAVLVLDEVRRTNQAIAVGALTLMDPEFEDLVGLVVLVEVREQQALEDVAYVS